MLWRGAWAARSGAAGGGLFRPQTGYCAGLIAEAAALWESLSQNQPLIGGNKRTAFAVSCTFLAIDGLRITAEAGPAYDFIIGLCRSGRFAFARLDSWLRANVTAL